MNKLIRTALASGTLAVALAGCGGTTQQVGTADPGSSTKAGAVAARVAETPTTVAPTGVPLSQITVVGEGTHPQSGPIKLDAKVYDNSVYQSLGCGGGFLWTFDLNRSYSKLNAVVGLDDFSIADDSADVKFVTDDDQTVGQVTVTLGKVMPVEVNLNGALRLRIEVTRSGGGCIAETGYGSTLALGDARLTRA